MEKARVTIALPNAQASDKIQQILRRSGYAIVDMCTSGFETLRKVRANPPDILLINFDMPDTTGLEVATIIGDENLSSVVLFINSDQRDYCLDLVQDYDITLFLKPVNAQMLLNAIDVVQQSRRHYQKLSRELTQLKEGLESRKIIERAKGILMKRKNISEGEAYRRIQKMSMDTRVAMRDIAVKVIELAEKNIDPESR